MKISVTNAQALIHTLQAGVDAAMKAGHHEFDFVTALQADDDAARAELQKAIEAARPAPTPVDTKADDAG